MSGNTIGMAEALIEARKTKNTTLKVEALQALPQTTKDQLGGIFQLAYNPHISWLLPPGTPPYKPLDEDTDREKLFVQILESIEPADAELVIQMKERNIKGVSKAVVQKAFPDLGL